jgi:methylase of polypeptide subunit release factors
MSHIPPFNTFTHKRLTEKAHAALAHILHTGNNAIDATVGNGHDTIFLAQLIAPTGHIIGFDIQASALETTHKKLIAHNLDKHVELKLISHSHIQLHTPASWKHNTTAIVFNLGYLPGSTDKSITTQSHSTLEALNASLNLLKINGAISLMTYPGHPEGKLELTNILHWAPSIQSTNKYFIHHETSPSTNPQNPSPEWIWIQRLV